MSVWRSFLKSLLPFLFKASESAATAAVEKKDIGQAVADSLSNMDTSAVDKALEDVVVKTAGK